MAGWGNSLSAYGFGDLDLDVWLPNTPNALDIGQPAKYIVGDSDSGADIARFLEGDPTGTLFAFPFAIYNREGGMNDSLTMESTTISSRKAHAPLAQMQPCHSMPLVHPIPIGWNCMIMQPCMTPPIP